MRINNGQIPPNTMTRPCILALCARLRAFLKANSLIAYDNGADRITEAVTGEHTNTPME